MPTDGTAAHVLGCLAGVGVPLGLMLTLVEFSSHLSGGRTGVALEGEEMMMVGVCGSLLHVPGHLLDEGGGEGEADGLLPPDLRAALLLCAARGP